MAKSIRIPLSNNFPPRPFAIIIKLFHQGSALLFAPFSSSNHNILIAVFGLFPFAFSFWAKRKKKSFSRHQPSSSNIDTRREAEKEKI
jgi:hypothetical protein